MSRTRIISFILTLVLLFGTVSTTLFAVGTADLEGGVITDEDIKNGSTDALISSVPEAGGILSLEALSAIVSKIKTLDCDNGKASSDAYGNLSVKTEGGRTYTVVGAPTKGLDAGGGQLRRDIGFDEFAGFDVISTDAAKAYKGQAFVFSFDLRLDAGFDTDIAVTLMSRAASVNGSALKVIQPKLFTISANGGIEIPSSGTERDGKTLDFTLKKGATEFTTIAVHVRPQDNAYRLYADGAPISGDIVFLTAEEQRYIADLDIGGTYTNHTDPLTVEYEGTDFLLSLVRMFLFDNESWLKGIDGPVFSYDNIKLYYSDYYIECAEHDASVGKHTADDHDEATMTASGTVCCNSCNGKWTVTVPMDQTGNGLCDLCEINNASGELTDRHTTKEIQSSITPDVGALTLLDGTSKSSYKGKNVTVEADKFGNSYFVPVGGVTDYAQINNEGLNTTDLSALYSNFKTNKTVGRSFVLQADLRLNEGFSADSDVFSMQVYVYAASNGSSIGTRSSFSKNLLQVSRNGNIRVIDGATFSSDIEIPLTEDAFTTVAIHVRAAENQFDLYINGETKPTWQNLTIYTEAELNRFKLDLNSDGQLTKGDDITCVEDFALGFVRFNNVSAKSTDILNLDNLMLYFADEYEDDFVGHEMVSTAHAHDYSKKCITYGSSCRTCGQSNGGYAVLDANGDKICDICAGEQLKTGSVGILAPEKLSGIVGSKNVILSSSITADGKGFSKLQNADGYVKTVNDGGNYYLKYSANTSGVGEAYVNANAHNSADLMLASFASDSGKAFVYSLDVRLESGYDRTQNLCQLASYMKATATDENGKASAFGALTRVYTQIDENGYLLYYDAAKASYECSGIQLTKGADKFTTVSIHVRPEEGSYGLYTIYADGVAAVKDVQFLSSAESESISWTAVNGTVSLGASDYVLGFVRSLHLYIGSSDKVVSGDFVSIDNPKLYYSDSFVEHAKHEFVLTGHDHDVNESTINASYACNCGEKRTASLPLDTLGGGSCDTCGNYVLAGGVMITGRQVLLGDLITARFYALVSEEAIANESAYAVISTSDKTERIKLSEAELYAEGVYFFDIKLKSIDMAKDISFSIELDGEAGNSYVTSIKDYAEALLRDENQGDYTHNIAEAMLNYGAYAQKYFAEKHGDGSIAEILANEMLEDSKKDLSYINTDTLAPHIIKITGTNNGVVFTNATLVLDSDVTLKIYFTAPDGASVSINGKPAEMKKEGDEYLVSIGGILPKDFDFRNSITVTVNGKSMTASISVLGAINALLYSNASEAFCDLGRAIYAYSVAARLYISEASDNTAQVVLKNGAKGAAALIVDDGKEQGATYAAKLMQEYTDISVTFALITSNYATLTKSSGEYVIDENGKYTFTQSETQKNAASFWIGESERENSAGEVLPTGILNLVDENGNTLRARIELISHSHSHKLPADGDYYAELLGARHVLQGLFGYDSEALVTPGSFNKTDEYYKVKEDVYIAGRGTDCYTDASLMVNTLDQFAKEKRERLNSYMVSFNRLWLDDSGKFSTFGISAREALNAENAANGIADVSHVEAFIDAAMEMGGLAAFCIHDIFPTSYKDGQNTAKYDENGKEIEGDIHIYEEQADAIFAYVQKHAETGELWSTTYSTAVQYYCEWYSSSLDVRSLGDELIAISLTDDEDDELCHEELTVKVSVPDAWESVKTSAGTVLTVKGEAGAKYVLVNILPDSGIVTLTAA